MSTIRAVWALALRRFRTAPLQVLTAAWLVMLAQTLPLQVVMTHQEPTVRGLGWLLSVLFWSALTPGWLGLLMGVVRGDGAVKVSRILQQVHAWLSTLAVAVLYALAVLGGLVLLVVPGLLVAIRGQFALMVVAEGELHPYRAWQRSWALTRGRVLEAAWVVASVAVVQFVGLWVPWGLGMLLVVPLGQLALVTYYVGWLRQEPL